MVSTGGEKSGTASGYRCTPLLALGFAASTSISTPATWRHSKPNGRTASAMLRRSRRSTAIAISRVIRAANGPFSETCRKTATPPTTRYSIPADRKADVTRLSTSKSCSTCSSYAVAEITGLWSQRPLLNLGKQRPSLWRSGDSFKSFFESLQKRTRGADAPRLTPSESRFYFRSRLRMKGDRATRHSERLRADGNGPRPMRWELRPRSLAPQPAAEPPGPIRPRQLRPPLCRGFPAASLPKQPSPPPAMRAPFPESR